MHIPNRRRRNRRLRGPMISRAAANQERLRRLWSAEADQPNAPIPHGDEPRRVAQLMRLRLLAKGHPTEVSTPSHGAVQLYSNAPTAVRQAALSRALGDAGWHERDGRGDFESLVTDGEPLPRVRRKSERDEHKAKSRFRKNHRDRTRAALSMEGAAMSEADAEAEAKAGEASMAAAANAIGADATKPGATRQRGQAQAPSAGASDRR